MNSLRADKLIHIKDDYPYSVVLKHPAEKVHYDMAEWWLNEITFDDMIIIQKHYVDARQQEFLITYGFKDESVATLFKLKFG